MNASSKKGGTRNATASPIRLSNERELRKIIDTTLRLAKSLGVEETEVHVDEVADALTRFANNGIHQNVAEHGLTVSVRTVAEGRTARATTNRVDEDSLRNAIEGSLSLAASQPKNPVAAPHARPAKISPREPLHQANRRHNSRRSRAGRATRLRFSRETRPGRRRNFLHRAEPDCRR